MSLSAEGGCFCGAIRYRISGEPVDVMHCHCVHCRKVSGAAVLTFVTVGPEQFEWLQGEPRRYGYRSDHYDDGVERLFCGDCGSQLGWSNENDPTVDVTVGSLDDPNLVEPTYHVFTRSRVRWLHLSDDLPRHDTRSTD